MSTIINPNEVINGGIVRPTPLNARFDVQLISPNVLVAELRYLKPLLCAELYDDMIAENRQTLKKVDEVFMRGRKQNITIMMLTQSYFKTNRRQNS